MMLAKERPFTRLAMALMGPKAEESLNAGRCPLCHGEIGDFRDAISRKEFEISGMCQECQDKFFDAKEA